MMHQLKKFWEGERVAKLTDVGLVVERFVESDGGEVEEPDAV